MIEATVTLSAYKKILEDLFGDRLYTALLYGNMVTPNENAQTADECLLMVVASDLSIHYIRATLASVIESIPTFPTLVIVPEHQLAQYVHLHPMDAFAATNGTLLYGSNLLGALKPASAEFYWVKISSQLLLASKVLTNKESAEAQTQLHTLNRAFHTPTENTTVSAQISYLYAHFEPYIAMAESEGSVAAPLADAPACLPRLQAVYQELDKAILVLPHNAAEIIRTTDWAEVKQWLSDDFRHIVVTTIPMFKLMMEYGNPLAFESGYYQYYWGNDILETVSKSPLSRKIKVAARSAPEICFDYLPNLYLNTKDDDLSTLLHDTQNKLLNIQLHYELLMMHSPLTYLQPPRLTVNRMLPPAQRIDAIFSYLGKWLALYDDLYKNYEQNAIS